MGRRRRPGVVSPHALIQSLHKQPCPIMQIDITSLSAIDLFTFSHSRAEGGENAGQNTWKAALEDASTRRPPLLSSPESIEAFKDWLKDFGAWSEDECNSWTDEECNALFLQWVAGDVRAARYASLEDIDWDEYEAQAREGNIPANICRADDGRIFFSLQH